MLGSQEICSKHDAVLPADQEVSTKLKIPGNGIRATTSREVSINIRVLAHQPIDGAPWSYLALGIARQLILGRDAGDGSPPTRTMPNKITLRVLLKNFLQAGQARLVGVSLVVEMKQNRQANFSTASKNCHVARVIKSNPRFVLTKSLGHPYRYTSSTWPPVPGDLQSKENPGIDRAERDQAVTVIERLGQHEVSGQRITG